MWLVRTWPGRTAPAGAVLRYELPGRPGEEPGAAHRDLLTLLRPQLATIWLDVIPGPAGWPPACAAAVSDARARLAAVRAPGPPTRPGRGAKTLALDPADSEDFTLALALAPWSTAVEAMTRQGRLVLARLGAGDPLAVRLTPAERADLVTSRPDLAWRLRPAGTLPAPAAAVPPGGLVAGLAEVAGGLALSGPALSSLSSLSALPGLADGGGLAITLPRLFLSAWLTGHGLLVLWYCRLRRSRSGRSRSGRSRSGRSRSGRSRSGQPRSGRRP